MKRTIRKILGSSQLAPANDEDVTKHPERNGSRNEVISRCMGSSPGFWTFPPSPFDPELRFVTVQIPRLYDLKSDNSFTRE
jgi:hypothetical protein